MTAPLGYAAGGPASITALEKRGLGEKEFDLREDIVQKTNEMISYLNKRVGEQSFGAGPAAEITNYLTEERRKENPDYDRLNEMYLDYSSMDDFKDAQPKEEKGMGEKIMQGLGELFGGRGAGASELGDMLDTYIPILKAKIIKLEADGLDATGEKNWLEYYEDLRRRQD